MIITEQERQKLLKNLPPDFRNKVVRITGCSPNTVTNVLHKGHENLEVAEALHQVAKDYSKSKKRVRANISKLPDHTDKAKAA